MNDFLKQISDIAVELFGVPSIIVILGAAVVGGFLRRLPGYAKVGPIAVSLVAYFVWVNLFVFPYPPGSEQPDWFISGTTLTAPAKAILATDSQVADLSISRRNSELVYIFEGDVQQVWTGSSIFWIKIAGQLIFAVLTFGAGATLTSLGVKLFGGD